MCKALVKGFGKLPVIKHEEDEFLQDDPPIASEEEKKIRGVEFRQRVFGFRVIKFTSPDYIDAYFFVFLFYIGDNYFITF